MSIDQRRVQELVERPTESLNVEVKRWLNPTVCDHQAKLVRAILAIRNRNGGELVIGFDDKTLQPDPSPPPADLDTIYHVDQIQTLISRFAAEPFGVSVHYGVRDGRRYPIISVPSGVRTPVAAKSDLRCPGGEHLIKHGAVFFRTLRANGTISSAEARPEDWKEIVEICFDNREADIGRFLRRHLGSRRPELEQLSALSGSESFARSLLDQGHVKFLRAISESKQTTETLQRIRTYGTHSVALVIDGDIPSTIANESFIALGLGPIKGFPSGRKSDSSCRTVGDEDELGVLAYGATVQAA